MEQDPQRLTIVNEIRLETERQMAYMQIAPLSPTMPPNLDPGVLKANELEVSTNIFGMVIPKETPIYRYSVKIHLELNGNGQNLSGNTQGDDIQPRRPRIIDFTGKVSGDPNCVTRRLDCLKIFKLLMRSYRDVFSSSETHYFYDSKSILFTLVPLNFDEDFRDFFIQPPKDDLSFGFAAKITVTIQKAKEGFKLTVSSLSAYVNRDLKEINHSLQQFLEIGIAQPVLNDIKNHVVINTGATYFMDPFDFGFSERDMPQLKEGKYLAIGAQKSVRFMEGPRGRNAVNAAAIIETKKTPFHVKQLLVDKIASIVRMGQHGNLESYQIESLRRAVKGLYVCSTHRKSGLLKIFDLSDKNAQTHTIEANDRFEGGTVERYFKKIYNVVLKYPEAPLIVVRDRMRQNNALFPPEVLEVADNQRVTTEQQSREQISSQIRACAVLPNLLRDQVSKTAKAIGLFDNKYLQQAGIKMINDPLKFSARMLPPPLIDYGRNNQPVKPDHRGTWKGDINAKFLIPAICKKWAAFLINPNARDAIDEGMMNELINRLVGETTRRGMRIGNPVKIGTVEANENAMNHLLDDCVRNGVEFAFFVHAGMDTDIHGFMKYFELKDIVTQDLKAQTATNIVVKRQNLTLENVVMKTNMKLGGLNWAIRLENTANIDLTRMVHSDVLYIGFGTNHPGGGIGSTNEEAPPTVVGFAANDNLHPFEFTGDWVYQKTCRDEKVEVIKDIIEKILGRFIKNRNRLPEIVVIYRSGCSEGQFADVISFEVPFIRLAMKNYHCDSAKLLVIVPNKKHNVRFVPANINHADKPPEMNIKPGMVVDTIAVHPTWHEFYLCSHTTLQGTAKVPRYTVLFNDTSLTADQIQEATYALAYGYQIVKSPVSLPAPAYIAEQYAKRGRAIYKAHITSEITQPGQTFYLNEELNNTITLKDHDHLRQTRINA